MTTMPFPHIRKLDLSLVWPLYALLDERHVTRAAHRCDTVSYTHLDVYKRQAKSDALQSEAPLPGPAIDASKPLTTNGLC